MLLTQNFNDDGSGFLPNVAAPNRSQVNEQEAVPVAFRYNIHPIESNRTNVFRPNALSSEVKANSLGALWIGKWDQLPDSKTVDVLWEADRFCNPHVCCTVLGLAIRLQTAGKHVVPSRPRVDIEFPR